MLCEGWRAEGKAKINEGETGGSNEVKAGPAAPHTDDVTAENVMREDQRCAVKALGLPVQEQGAVRGWR